MKSPDETHANLTYFGLLLKEKMELVKLENIQINDLKRKIRSIMIENKAETFDVPEKDLHLKCTRSFTFDMGMFKYEQKEIAPNFIKKEIVTKIKDVLDKKGLIKAHPEIYKKYLLENTARLRIE